MQYLNNIFAFFSFCILAKFDAEMGKFWMQMDSMMYWMRHGIGPGAMPASSQYTDPAVADPLAVDLIPFAAQIHAHLGLP
ncbi:hypothetical protein SFPGR_26220 [Sulfuriferula plumbiphila]|nr:hypothetical protein SFPGR_26220 [Sulfuriferula plumbiphila]